MAVLTRAQIQALITANIVENGNYGITSAQVAEILTDIADSFMQASETGQSMEADSFNVLAPETGYKVSGTKVIGAQGVSIEELAGGAILADVVTKVNVIIVMLRDHGLIATPV